MPPNAAPRVGIPLALDGTPRLRPGRRTHYLDTAYSRALAAAGALPVCLPGPLDAAEAAADLDGLLLPGGDDFAPPRPYPPAVTFHPVPDEQLAFDGALLAEALRRELPVLGICYGMQLLALHHGGALLYDIDTDHPGALRHRAPTGTPTGDVMHGLRVEAGSRLAGILRSDVVNSRHHQGVAEAGAGLRVCATAPDGVIEAIEAADERFVVGVQWHPETLGDEASSHLFQAFVLACREAAAARS